GISLPMPLAAPVTMATLSLRRMSRYSRRGRIERRFSLRRGLKIVVGDFAEAEREVANEMNGRDHLEHRQLCDGRKRVRRERNRRGTCPGALERHVLEIIFDQFANARAPSADRRDIGRLVLV